MHCFLVQRMPLLHHHICCQKLAIVESEPSLSDCLSYITGNRNTTHITLQANERETLLTAAIVYFVKSNCPWCTFHATLDRIYLKPPKVYVQVGY